MKKITVYLLAVLCMISALLTEAGASEYLPLFDEPDYLTETEETALIAELERIAELHRMEVVTAIFTTIDGASPMEYADDFYDYNGYGYGETKDGLILIVVMDTRDWWISTCGNAIGAFTDAGIDYIGEQIIPYLSSGDYYGAFSEFAACCDEFMTQAETGTPYDINNLPKEPFSAGMALVVALVGGFIISKLYTGKLKGELKTVAAQKTASSYLKEGSMNVTNSNDLFLYRHVSKTMKETSSSREGGSSTHTSSSGTSHGGGGGKF